MQYKLPDILGMALSTRGRTDQVGSLASTVNLSEV